jgi:hypothetical protein
MDIMEKQGRLSVDRPRQVAAGEILSGEQSVAFTHSGDRFRRMRRCVVRGAYKPHLTLQRDTERFTRTSALKQLIRISPSRCHM